MNHYDRGMALASELLHHSGVTLFEDQPDPYTNAEVRRRRLAQLAEQTVGGLKAIAEAAQVSAQNLDHITKRRIQGTKRADGKAPVISMGDKLARTIETAMGLTPGWLDWPFTEVDFDAYAALGSTQRLVVQVKVSQAVKEEATKKTAVRNVDKKAVSNKTVEKHYKALPEGAAEAAYRTASTTSEVRRRKPTEPELPFRGRGDE